MRAGYPKLDVLMNNAGIMLHKNLNVPAADLDALMAEVNINVGGAIRMSSTFVDVLAADEDSHHQRIFCTRVRAFAVCADLQCDQGGSSCLYPGASLPARGSRRGGDRTRMPPAVEPDLTSRDADRETASL